MCYVHSMRHKAKSFLGGLGYSLASRNLGKIPKTRSTVLIDINIVAFEGKKLFKNILFPPSNTGHKNMTSKLT